MEILITRSIESLISPPGSVIILLIIALLLTRRHWRAAATATALALLGLYVLSLPLTVGWLMQSLEVYPALQLQNIKGSPAQAIVVLGSGRYAGAPEYGGDTVSTGGLERLRYAVHLHKLTSLPLVVSGGSPHGEPIPEAVLMKESLANDFHITDVWLEDQSRTTAENAFFTKTLLEKKGIQHVYLVTHAWHMPRAVRIFEQSGLTVTAAPTLFSSAGGGKTGLLDWLPNAGALSGSGTALHEMAGMLWYQLRHRSGNADSASTR